MRSRLLPGLALILISAPAAAHTGHPGNASFVSGMGAAMAGLLLITVLGGPIAMAGGARIAPRWTAGALATAAATLGIVT